MPLFPPLGGQTLGHETRVELEGEVAGGTRGDVCKRACWRVAIRIVTSTWRAQTTLDTYLHAAIIVTRWGSEWCLATTLTLFPVSDFHMMSRREMELRYSHHGHKCLARHYIPFSTSAQDEVSLAHIWI